MADVTLRKPAERGVAGRGMGNVIYIGEFKKPRPAARPAGSGAFWNVVFAVLCLFVLVCVFYR